MKKLLAILVLAIAGAFSASAASPFLEFQPIQAGDGMTAFNVQAGVTTPVHRNIAVGAGIGITEKWNFNQGPLIPIFVRAEFSGTINGFTPFFSFDLGYEINTENTHWGAILVNPMAGLKFGRWYGGIGYLAHCWTPDNAGSTSCFNMKIGYTF